LYVIFELANKEWKLLFSNEQGRHHCGQMTAGEMAAFWAHVSVAKQRLNCSPTVTVYSCYEAGRDGHWLHRYLHDQGIINYEVDASSIEVPRRARRAKTDRLDLFSLRRLLVRHVHGERGVWHTVNVPTAAQEDARRPTREHDQLTDERRAHINRIKSLLVLHNVREGRVGGARWPTRLMELKTTLPAQLWCEIERESARLAVVEAQLKKVDKQIEATAHGDGPTTLRKIKGFGAHSGVVWWQEVQWRGFRDRRQIGGFFGLTPTPYQSGDSRREQGISKHGPKRLRTLMIELAWRWLRYQPDTALSRWYRERYSGGGARQRKVGIVAMARKLLIALWRYLKDGVAIDGLVLQGD
jgi:transposase